MAEWITRSRDGLHLAIKITDEGDVRLLHLSPRPWQEGFVRPHEEKFFRLLEVQSAGENFNDHHGRKHTGTNPGQQLCYTGHRWEGDTLILEMKGGGLKVAYHMAFFPGIAAVRTHAELAAIADDSPCLEYVSAFSLTGIDGGSPNPAQRCRISYAHNSWCNELQWRRYTLEEKGLAFITDEKRLHHPEEYQNFSTGSIRIAGYGAWTSSEYLPMGAFENGGEKWAMAWQVETSSPWFWEMSTITGRYYLQVSGPDDGLHHWHKTLNAGEHFSTPTVTVAFAPGERERAFATLNQVRRRIYRPSEDIQNLPVIFNEYMSSLGEPMEKNLLPLIDQAAALGCEYFCIDAGWYAHNNWWNDVGHWYPANHRFPSGLDYVMDYIRGRGMIPGLWLEPEVMGINSPAAKRLPAQCYFSRNGRRVVDHGRYQLDFRHPEVIRYLDEVVDRLVDQYGAGYLKLDYNIDGGHGTEINGESLGQALLDHTQAYRSWLAGVVQRHPGLVIENCASGGMRITYHLLSLLDIQSISDQGDLHKISPMAAASPTAVTPEQAAIWSLPKPGQSDEDVVFHMVNTLLMRIHQSGEIDKLPQTQLILIREAIALYKTYRRKIPRSIPFWPLGLPSPGENTLCLGLHLEDVSLLAVWKYDLEESAIPLPEIYSQARQLYPTTLESQYRLDEKGRTLYVRFPAAPAARLYRLIK